MPNPEEEKYVFCITPRGDDIGVICDYLRGLKLQERGDYKILENSGIVQAILTLDQVEWLASDLAEYVVINPNFSIELAGRTDSERKRLERIVRR